MGLSVLSQDGTSRREAAVIRMLLLLLVFSVFTVFNVSAFDHYDYDDYDYYYDYDYSDYYGDYFDSDYFLDYYTCQDDFCMEKEMWVEAEKKIPVPNTELIIHDSEDSHYVETAGVLAECAAGLGVKDLAEYVKPCYEIEGGYEEDWWLYMESCVFSNIGWLNKDTSLNTAKFASIPGVADKVAQCVSSSSSRREGAAPAVTRRTRGQENRRRINKQNNNRRGRSNKRGTRRSARRGGRTGANGKTGKRKGRGAMRLGRDGRRTIKGGKETAIQGKRKRKGGNRTGRRGQGTRRNPREAESSSLDVPDGAMIRPEQVRQRQTREERREGRKNNNRREKKKKKQEVKKILKSISLDKFPSEETIDQLWCIRYAVNRGLRNCAGPLIAQNLNDTQRKK